MYLSYPALYTHIKTKHDGIPMAGTNAPQFRNNRRGRGRPRKTKETTVATKKREAHPADNIRNNPNFADEVSFAREMGYLVAGSETDPLIFFPMIYVNNERLEHPIRTKLEEMIASQIEIDGSIESVFAEFLYVRYKFTAAKLYKSFIVLVCMLHKYLQNKTESIQDVPLYLNEFSNWLGVTGELDNFEMIVNIIKHFADWLYVHKYTTIKIN